MDLFESIMELRDTTAGPHFAAFDFDGSLIQNDSFEAVLAYMVRHNFPNAREHFEHYYSLLDSGSGAAAYQFGATTLRGMSEAGVYSTVRRVMMEEGTDITKAKLLTRNIAKGIALRQNVVSLMRQLQRSEVEPWIISASPQLVVEGAMEYFGLEARVIGVRNIVDKLGFLTDQLEEPLSIFGGKVDCIQKYIHASAFPLLGVGDSMNDFPMLKYSHLRAVVDRGNELAATAQAEGWLLL